MEAVSLDGHGSHKIAESRDFCPQNCIITLCIPAHTSHLLQPLDASYFGPLKKAHGSQIENKMRLGVDRINKEEYLPIFFAAHQQIMSQTTSTSGFKATSLIPFDPERVFARLGANVEATPLPYSSQSSWGPKTRKPLPEIKKQDLLVLTENHKRRRLSARSAENPILAASERL